MIYTVTFNPSLDYIVSVDAFQLGFTNRTSSELILPGKGNQRFYGFEEPWNRKYGAWIYRWIYRR